MNEWTMYANIFDLFSTAKENGLKYPKIHIIAENNDELVLSMAGAKSVLPGSISICSPGAFGENKFYGRIGIDNRINWNKHETPEHIKSVYSNILQKLNDDPVATAKLYAACSGSCSFCGTKITTDESMSVGYGPICAAKYGLPWGGKTGANELQIELPDLDFEPVSEANTDHPAITNAAILDAIIPIIADYENGKISALIAGTKIHEVLNNG